MITDPRMTKLAKSLVEYSLEVKKGEVVYIDMVGLDTKPLAIELVQAVTAAGGIPYWNTFDDFLSAPFFRQADEAQVAAFGKFQAAIMEKVDCYIGVRGQTTPYEFGSLNADRSKWKETLYWKEVHSNVRLKKRWCVLRYPNAAMATMANKGLSDYEDFYFQVCNVNYEKMSAAMDALVKRMARTDKVRLVAPGTDISFSIKDIPVIKCAGKVNVPDGEVFSAPVRDSVNGIIKYNTSTIFRNTLFKNITLEVRNGRIERCDCETGDRKVLEGIFDTDAGARYFGEFAIGVNPYILDPQNDTLFDEKIAGSIHFTPGSSYDDAFNGNKSAVHWDIVLIQRPEYGGGEIYFDGECIRRDGLFIVDELKGLNPEALG